MAVGRSRRRAKGSIATAPASKRAPLLRWWCRWFSDFTRRPHGTGGSTETGLVTLYGWNSRNLLAAHEALKDNGKRLRLTLRAGNRRARVRAASPSRGLSRSPISEIYFVRWRASAAPPNTMDFFLAPFLFSEIAAPATNGRQAIAPRARGRPAPAAGQQFFL